MASPRQCAVQLIFATDGLKGGGGETRTLYTRDTLASTLRLMGAKPRHSLKVSARVFDALDVLARQAQLGSGGARSLPHRLPRATARNVLFAGNSATLPRPHFEALVLWALAEFQYAKPDQTDDLRMACRRADAHTAAAPARALTRAWRVGQDTRAAEVSHPIALRHQRHGQVHPGGAAGVSAERCDCQLGV